MTPEQYETLSQRARYLTLRAGIKDQVGWDSTYEAREREALEAALSFIVAHQPHLLRHQTGTRGTPGCQRP